MIGAYGSYYSWDSIAGDVHLGQVAGEGAWYWNRLTLEGVAGAEFGNHATSLIGFDVFEVNIKTRFFDKVNVAYYLTDNFNVYVGHRYLGGKNAAAFGGEWGIPISNTSSMASLFVEGRAGDYTGVWGGLRLYFGEKPKTLIRRHREDDPIEWAPESLTTMSNQETQTTLPSNHNNNNPPPPPPPPPET
jgi:hypothetical protein